MTETARDYRTRLYERYTSEKMSHVASMDEQARRRWGRAVLNLLDGWLPENGDAEIVDLGCGPGTLLSALRDAGYRRLRGVDRSPEQARTATLLGFPVEQADIISFLDSHKQTFDLITAFDVIEHFRKDEIFEFLDRCRSALAPGGTLILQTPNAESPWGLMYRYHDFTHEVAFDPCALEHVLRVARFERFAARECGPYVHGPVSLTRWLMWKAISGSLRIWNLAETGTIGSGIYTRNFVARAIRGT